VLNRGLPRSPRAQQLCAELAGRTVAIAIAGSARYVLVESTGQSFEVERGHGWNARRPAFRCHDQRGSVQVCCTLGPCAGSSAAARRCPDRGRCGAGAEFRELALLLRPDIEEDLSLSVGDVPAHQLGRFARAALGWTRKAASTTVRNAAEYLAHERRDLVPRSEAEQFLQGVDTLREDVDRLAARIDLLTRP